MKEGVNPLPWPPRDEHLTAFLPLVYVAWSDGILSETEMGRIREAVGEAELRAEERVDRAHDV